MRELVDPTMTAELELTQAWLETCYRSLCRRVPGGIIAHSVEGPDGHGELLLVLDLDLRDQAEAEAQKILGPDFVTKLFESGLAPNATVDTVSLHQVIAELQAAILEPDCQLPESSAGYLMSFLLKNAGYRSNLFPLRRVVYHLTPSGESWKLKRRDDDWEQLFATKEEGVKEGASRARSHPEGQLIIHKANGQFEEERAYGTDPPGRG